MAGSKRVAFTFDERSLKTLEQMTSEGDYTSMADTVRESLQINRALQSQAKHGYTEVIMRNPDTGEERVVVIPRLQTFDQ